MLWRQPNKIPEKGFFLPNLLHGLEQDGCFLCAAVIEDSEQSLNALFDDGVMGEETRERVIAANGFCNWHAWRATFILSASAGLAAVYEPLTGKINTASAHLLKILKESREPRLFSPLHLRNVRNLLNAGTICPVCESNRTLEKGYLSDLLDWFNDAALTTAFEKSFGLCLPHLQMATDEFPQHINLSSLLETERKKFGALQAQLAESNRKRDHQLAKKSRSAEQDSWRRAVELFVGKRGVFPRQTK